MSMTAFGFLEHETAPWQQTGHTKNLHLLQLLYHLNLQVVRTMLVIWQQHSLHGTQWLHLHQLAHCSHPSVLGTNGGLGSSQSHVKAAEADQASLYHYTKSLAGELTPKEYHLQPFLYTLLKSYTSSLVTFRTVSLPLNAQKSHIHQPL
jgi:hypothetical protein